MKTDKFLQGIGTAVLQIGGNVKKGIIAERELQNDEEIRVSLRSSQFMGSVELFTMRNLQPDDYHLILLAIPRKKDGS